jgi:hypothetical protein
LSQHKSLVFWISDFHMPMSLIKQTMNAMSAHHVIPVVLWDDQEYKKLPRFGFSNMIDPETGHNTTIFFRQSVRDQFEASFIMRKQALETLFTSFDSQAIYISDQYDPEIMSHYFEQIMG